MDGHLRRSIPPLSTKPFLTDGGLETTIVYKEKIDLPCFAAITLLSTTQGTELLRRLYIKYVDVALSHNAGIVLEARVWRGAPIWAQPLGLTSAELIALNVKAVELLLDLRQQVETQSTPIVISGNIGPLSDAYKLSNRPGREFVREQYREQIKALVDAGVDMLSITTITDTEEMIAAIEIAREHDIPIHASFSVERDGKLLNHRNLEEAIAEVDTTTNGYAAYFGINCAHPAHVKELLKTMPESTRSRIGSFRGNASLRSHEELDNAAELDRGDIAKFATDFEDVARLLPSLRVAGGCCGTDEEHVAAVAGKLLR